MRGQKALYNNISTTAIPDQRGEKSKLSAFLDERDNAMVHRFYYHANLLSSRYDNCLHALPIEFYLLPLSICEGSIFVVCHGKCDIYSFGYAAF
jgi:hypothetical protein